MTRERRLLIKMLMDRKFKKRKMLQEKENTGKNE
jgi:hypothetical protein